LWTPQPSFLSPDAGAFPTDAAMAAGAVSAKAAMMHVIARMAVAAILRQLHFIRRLHVTGLARDLGMRTLERKMGGLAMVELPELPTVRVVACGARFAQVAFMDIVTLVATDAISRGVAIGARGVAFLAADTRV